MKIDLELTDEEQIMAESLERYFSRNYDPNYEAWLGSRSFPREIMRDLSQLILPGTIPERGGGGGLPDSTMGIFSEMMGKHEIPVPAFLSMHFAKLLPMIRDEDVRAGMIGRYLAGNLVICGAFTEPGAGSDSAGISTRAVRKGDGYVIDGEKAFVSGPGNADVHIVTARIPSMEERKRHGGITLFLVDGKARGVEPYHMESMATAFDGDFGGIRLTGAEVPGSNLIGNEGEGFRILMKILNVQRVHVALYSIGLAERSLEEAVEYARMRKSFGVPLSSHQAVSFRLAEDWTRLNAARLLAYHALELQDSGKENSAECAAVKWYGCEIAFEAASHALQTLGASGYVRSSALERRFRATRGFLIGDGTPDIQKLIISRKLFGKEYSP